MPNCGNCLFHVTSKGDKGGVMVLCGIDTKWYKESYSCEDFIEYSNLGISERLTIAQNIRESKENERRHREVLRSNRRLQIIILIVGFILGMIAQWVTSKYF
jgi:hypothetical protein